MTDTTNQYESVYPAITDVTSRERDNIVLLHGNSNENVYNALGFQVSRVQRRIERVTNQVSLAPSGDAGDSVGFGFIGENGHSQTVGDPGDEVFRIDTGRSSTIVEYGVAVDQDNVLVAVQNPNGETVMGLREGSSRARGFGPDDFPTRGAVESVNTRTGGTHDVPTTALSETEDQGLVRIDSREGGANYFAFAFKNQANGAQNVTMTAMGTTYEVRPVTNTERVLDMVSGQVNRRLLTYGGWGNTRPNLPAEWYDHRVEVGPADLRL